MKKFKDFTEDEKSKEIEKALDLGCDLEDRAYDVIGQKRKGNSTIPKELKKLLKNNGSKEALDILDKMKKNDKNLSDLGF